MFKLKPLSGEAIPAALGKATCYRYLNEPAEAESICLDILEVEPGNQQALITYILSLTDQFHSLPEHLMSADDNQNQGIGANDEPIGNNQLINALYPVRLWYKRFQYYKYWNVQTTPVKCRHRFCWQNRWTKADKAVQGHKPNRTGQGKAGWYASKSYDYSGHNYGHEGQKGSNCVNLAQNSVMVFKMPRTGIYVCPEHEPKKYSKGHGSQKS